MQARRRPLHVSRHSATDAATVAPFLLMPKTDDSGRSREIRRPMEILAWFVPRDTAISTNLYNPNRLKGPLKRVDNRFEPISWEQAYKEISQKINLILMDQGPQSVFWVNYPQSNHMYALRLMHALGSPHYFTHGSTCFTARNAGWVTTVGEASLPMISPTPDISSSSVGTLRAGLTWVR